MFLFRSWNIGPPFSTRHDRWFRHFVLYRCASNGSFFQLTKSICGAARWADDGIRSGSLWRTDILKYSRFKSSSRRRCQSSQWPCDIWRKFTIFICVFILKRWKLKINPLSYRQTFHIYFIMLFKCMANFWWTFFIHFWWSSWKRCILKHLVILDRSHLQCVEHSAVTCPVRI